MTSGNINGQSAASIVSGSREGLLQKRHRLTRRPVIRRADDNPGLGAGRMDYLASANIDRHMIDGIPAGIKQQIPRLNRLNGDRSSICRLLPGIPPCLDPEMLIDPHHKAGAVRPFRQAASSVHVRIPQKLLGISHQRRPGRRDYRRRCIAPGPVGNAACPLRAGSLSLCARSRRIRHISGAARVPGIIPACRAYPIAPSAGRCRPQGGSRNPWIISLPQGISRNNRHAILGLCVS